jgi:hypothetical protein
MREIRTSGSEGGGIESNRFSLPLSGFRYSSICERSRRLRKYVGARAAAGWTPACAGVTRRAATVVLCQL